MHTLNSETTKVERVFFFISGGFHLTDPKSAALLTILSPFLGFEKSRLESSQMFAWDDYELLDFGGGRKLERFNDFRLDRPSPSAEETTAVDPDAWVTATARFHGHGEKGRWSSSLETPWELDCETFQLEMRLTPFGHVGVFPEQVENWRWIDRQGRRSKAGLRMLNLFAYTGGSTLAAAAAGAEVVHVDSARNVVSWARRNAELSGLGNAPIRWIVEDVKRFVQRELKRGNEYDAIVLDPPSYGHGPKGETWKVSRDLLPTLEACVGLLSTKRAFLLLTCHSTGFGPAELGAYLRQVVFGHCQGHVEAKALQIATRDGRHLPAGVVARVQF